MLIYWLLVLILFMTLNCLYSNELIVDDYSVVANIYLVVHSDSGGSNLILIPPLWILVLLVILFLLSLMLFLLALSLPHLNCPYKL